MTTDYFTSKWIMTVFACFLPFEQLPAIFDMFLMDGWRAVFRIGIALLKEMEPRMLGMDMVEMCGYFRDNVRKERVASDFKLFEQAARVRVNSILVHITSSNFPFYPIDPQSGARKAEGAVLHYPSGGQIKADELLAARPGRSTQVG
jgi:Rab-GTPase-TBC domain